MSESRKINWTETVYPDLDVMWVEDYLIAWDATIAVPVLQNSNAALHAIERGLVKKVSRQEAQLINDRFVGHDKYGELEFAKERIAARWEQMRAAVAPKVGTTLHIRLPDDYVSSDGPGLLTPKEIMLQSRLLGLQSADTATVSVQRYPDTTYKPADHMAAMDAPRLPKEAEQDRIWNLLVQACTS